MLSRLIINNIALIDRLDIELSDGLNVLTGETGAGKSIIIDSVNLALGERGGKELISAGKPKARVEAFFDVELPQEGFENAPEPDGASAEPAGDKSLYGLLNELGIDYSDGELIIVRELTPAGKSLCRVNGEIVTLATLKQITSSLVDIHGQHEHQSLLEPRKHIAILDGFREKSIAPLKSRVAALAASYHRLTNSMNSGFISEAERERRLDILNYQIKEIDKAALRSGEEAELNEELKLLANAEKINNALERGGELLSGDGGALDRLRGAVGELAEIAAFSEQYNELYSRLDSSFYELEDAAYQLRELRFGFEYSPERLNELETRLDLINSLKRKYGGTVEAVLNYLDEAQKELDELTGADDLRARLAAERDAVLKEYASAAKALSDERKKAAAELKAGVDRELHELGMEKAVFDVRFIEKSGEPHINGSDDVEFLLSANQGEPLKSLAKVASGGELSRIMLAIKTVCAGTDGTPTLIFDEVDTGISGRTAVKVGERLSLVAKSKQVLSVTHLPQIAAFADRHLLVEKHTEAEKTVTGLRPLSDGERRNELARIMGAAGQTDSALMYADELIIQAERFKKQNTKR